jgi:poly-gamma-glutamate synthesis protein (capsule biosynthesis protein)
MYRMRRLASLTVCVALVLAVAPTALASTSAAAPGRSEGVVEVKLAFTGDTLIHLPQMQQAWRNGGRRVYDFRPMFERIRPLIESVDLAVCHLELPTIPQGQGIYPRYAAPKEIIDALAWAGYDRCSTASNHAWNRKGPGVTASAEAFEAVGMTFTGTARTAAEAAPTVLDVKGIRIAHLSYTYGLNGRRLPAGQPWWVNLIDRARMADDIRAARALGAEYVIVSIHAGAQFRTVPNITQRSTLGWLLANTDVDLVIGHHAHVVQPIESIDGRYVVWGLGNHLSNQPTSAAQPRRSQDGALALVTLVRNEDGSITTKAPEIVPTWVHKFDGTFRIFDARDYADGSLTSRERSLLKASYERTRSVVGSYFAVAESASPDAGPLTG